MDIAALNIGAGVFQQTDERFAVLIPCFGICRYVAHQAAQAFAPAVLPLLVHIGLDKSREARSGSRVKSLYSLKKCQPGVLKDVAIRNLKRHAQERVRIIAFTILIIHMLERTRVVKQIFFSFSI